ncbi:glycosyltransferase family 8 protein [Pelagibius litoralis]|uniref:Glycosyltransferase family 8 protein n=1 Tax=Pelagibius litoralis TaxID=374515 RepID=A0A967C3A4_9PROT|nr:glycosyltransferase family 8 protein [Pelagibius litoralis]NIA67644.1 glycosyltransferase family 8 protein [Pelagibius litoralis]
MTGTPIKLIFGVDGSYSQHLAVTLISLLENNRGNAFDILVVTLNMTVQDKARIRSVVEGFANVVLRFQDFDISRYSHFRTDGHISHASYLRIFIPEILPESEERVLYLDCDLVVQEDIAPLWESDLGDKVIGAARNPFFVRHDDLELPADADYHNAGVLLINLKRWRERDGTARLIDFIEAHHAHLYAHDQDALNAVFLGEFAELAPQWNFQTSMLWCEPEALSLRYQEYRGLVENPAIIHYTTPSKPWHFGNTHPHKDIYYQYLMKTPYSGYRPDDISVASLLRRAVCWPQVAFRDQLPAAYYPTRRAFRHLKTNYLGLKA